MTNSQSLERIQDAGVNVLKISETSVLVKIDNIETENLILHPVYALCRGLSALGFRAIFLCGASDYFDELDEVTQGSNFEQCPGVWFTKDMTIAIPPANVFIDLTNDAFSHSLCAYFVSIRRSHCLYLLWGPTLAGISPTPLSEDEFLKLGLGEKNSSEISAPICRIAAGLALQEILMFASKMEFAAPLENTVTYTAFNGGPLQESGISKISEPIQNATIDVIGAGALGVHLLESLVPMLGQRCSLRVFDPDTIGPENTALQTPYTLSDVGKAKAIVITEKLQRFVCSDVMIEPFVIRYEDRPVTLPKPSVRIACPDSFMTRKLVNDISLKDGIPLAEAGTSPLAAQQRSYLKNKTACLECRIPDLSEKAEQEMAPASCIENRTLPGVNMIAGGILALETLKLLDANRGFPCTGTIMYDARFPQRFGVVDFQPPCGHGLTFLQKVNSLLR
jgi:molybdopterin/thiamine biosynthesis adenylyltransferase